jgi:hypothetical protein
MTDTGTIWRRIEIVDGAGGLKAMIVLLRATENHQTMAWIYLARGLSGTSGAMATPDA